ncbi:hypothetical protein C7S20_10300 [Christiangramia fulva]|uniref:Gylcosyl hydrolase 115 C-terminal domain-containing protein n=1 Tax=Christiangramia fulva TaxID=2126553 RepID=A0A2R3Z5R8_9FLAO|nr:glycosyl hydrolase 115 family protein [Christiangramia fulva]AVR45623.1 hypothetical protein C7S20_10300 [Christiangramia fulva]
MNKAFIFSLLFIFNLSAVGQEQDKKFTIIKGNEVASIVYDKDGSSLDSISAYLLAEDIFRISGKRPKVSSGIKKNGGNLILIGELNSELIKGAIGIKNLPPEFHIQRESYMFKTASHSSSSQQIFVIAGTDPRGTAYGVFELSKTIGVSPWYWWADVPMKKRNDIVLNEPDFFSKEPSVDYRGIFLNDEDWGLQPWAAKTFEPEVGDIGPKTYSKIFELLLRLKANTIWPAMHPSTRAFFHYPGNHEMASKYHIVVGSSHAEPMLRNNVDEWNHYTMGDFSYVSNRKNVYNYWEKRVKESSNLDAIYTVGMRGIHDSGMEGVESTEEAARVLSGVIQDQRALLEKYRKEPISEIPQAFTVYKEVLGLYDSGMKIPDDVTIIWTDDNYGYIRRLSNNKERQRAGGGGIYYHASYWGRPHDYLWLSTTHPGLIREEMMKAYKTDNKKIWILNVGDIKPAEYNIQLFMDMAYNASKFEDPEYLNHHLSSFYTSVFGETYGPEIANVKMKYYQLAFERKPEFMGWSQTEPTTSIDTTAYSPFLAGDEISNRINQYENLTLRAEKIKKELKPEYQDSYFQLIYYPVKAASFMNQKFLYRDLAIKYQAQNRYNAKEYEKSSGKAFDSIKALTHKYNHAIAGGKWENIMDMQPRRLPVYQKPEINLENLKQHPEANTPVGIAVENQIKAGIFKLPVFYEKSPEKHFFDIFLIASKTLKWKILKKPEWMVLNKNEGELTPSQVSERIFVGIDWQKWNQSGRPGRGKVKIRAASENFSLPVKIHSYKTTNKTPNIFVEKNGVVSIYAEDYTTKTDRKEYFWKKVPGLGYSSNLMQAHPFTRKPLETSDLKDSAPYMEYSIITESESRNAELILNALPTHPITKNHAVRIGVQWNENAIRIVDFQTYGRSEEWKQNVLRNLAKITIPVEVREAGKQSLKIYMIDEGVALDFIYLKLQDLTLPYSLLPETNFNPKISD